MRGFGECDRENDGRSFHETGLCEDSALDKGFQQALSHPTLYGRRSERLEIHRHRPLILYEDRMSRDKDRCEMFLAEIMIVRIALPCPPSTQSFLIQAPNSLC